MSSQYTSLASELRRLSLEHSQLQSQNNEHDKLKHELLVIHRRKVDEQEERCNRLQSTSRQYRKKRRKKKKKRSSSTIYPVHHHKQSTGTIGELPINALLSIESKHNSSYNKDYISLSNEYKRLRSIASIIIEKEMVAENHLHVYTATVQADSCETASFHANTFVSAESVLNGFPIYSNVLYATLP